MRTMTIDGMIRNWAGFAIRGSNVKCEFDMVEDLAPVNVDEGQMSQAINNLIINAVQAMPEGGIINIKAENVLIGADSKEHLSLKDGEYVKVSIKDAGSGIPEDIIQKIFDPYFTTKKKGSGLGLTTTFSIIRKHQGHLTVESIPGSFTEFHMYLPISSLEPPRDEPAVIPDQPVKGDGRILIMEDEEVLQNVAVEMVESLCSGSFY